MNRRRFLGLLAAGAVGLAVPNVLQNAVHEDPERALWQPGKVKVFDLGAMHREIEARDLGISMRFVRQYDAECARFWNRFDVIYGWAVVRPDLAARISA